MKTYSIATIPGDGIGKEVIPAGRELLEALADTSRTIRFAFENFGWGSDWFYAHGAMMPADGLDALRRKDAIDADEVEHSEHEHAEGNEALLALMEVADTASEEFSEKLHELSEALTHHLDEEERDVLNPARTEVGEDVRRKLGDTFAEERSRLIDSGCGELANVRKIVAAEQHT